MAIGKDGNWVNADRPLDESNYMSISEWCAWTTRVAAELLDKGGSDQLDMLRIKVQILSREADQLMTDFNEQLVESHQSLVADGKITEEELAGVSLEVNRNGEGTDEWNARSASGENTRDAKLRIEGKDKRK